MLGYKTYQEFAFNDTKIDVVWQKGKKKMTFQIDNERCRILPNIKKALQFKPIKHFSIVHHKIKVPYKNVFLIKLPYTKKIIKRGKEEQIIKELSILKKIIKENVDIKNQLKKFKKETKKSRATFFRYKKRLKWVR